MASSTFTQFLRQNDYATLAEIEEASQATVLYGGRIGTALIELGVLSPEQIDAALARYHDLPEIPKEWLAKPDAAARAALHVDLAKRHRVFPLQFEKRTLHVGMVDPRNEAVLDDIAFASGCVIAPYALGEFRFVQLMQRVFSIAPSSRFKALLDEAGRARVFRARAEQRKALAEKRDQVDSELAIGPLAADLELTDKESFFVTEEARASVAAAPPAIARAPIAKAEPLAITAQPALEIDDEPILLDRRAPTLQPLSVVALEQILAESPDRGRVIEASIELASRFAEVAALFVIRDGVAAGLSAIRTGKPLEIDAAMIPLAADTALAACLASRKPVRTKPSAALDKRLAKALRSDEETELAVFPIAIGERVVNLLVAQSSRGALGVTGDAALAALAPLIGAAYERLIRVQKQKAAAPMEASPPPVTVTAPAPAPAAPKPKTKAAIGALPLAKRVVKLPPRN